GHQLGAALVLAQQAERLRHRRGAHIIEAGGFHATSFAPAAMALSTRMGVNGVCDSSAAPMRASASLTAPNSTAGGAMAPPSPMPLAPNSVCGEGVSKWCRRRL